MTKHLTILILVGLSFSVGAQQLTKEGAIKIVMENNFDLAIADNAVKIAENNTSLLNSGYLPTLTGSAGATYNSDNLTAQFQDGRIAELDDANSDSRTAGLSLNYVIFMKDMSSNCS